MEYLVALVVRVGYRVVVSNVEIPGYVMLELELWSSLTRYFRREKALDGAATSYPCMPSLGARLKAR